MVIPKGLPAQRLFVILGALRRHLVFDHCLVIFQGRTEGRGAGARVLFVVIVCHTLYVLNAMYVSFSFPFYVKYGIRPTAGALGKK